MPAQERICPANRAGAPPKPRSAVPNTVAASTANSEYSVPIRRLSAGPAGPNRPKHSEGQGGQRARLGRRQAGGADDLRQHRADTGHGAAGRLKAISTRLAASSSSPPGLRPGFEVEAGVGASGSDTHWRRPRAALRVRGLLARRSSALPICGIPNAWRPQCVASLARSHRAVVFVVFCDGAVIQMALCCVQATPEDLGGVLSDETFLSAMRCPKFDREGRAPTCARTRTCSHACLPRSPVRNAAGLGQLRRPTDFIIFDTVFGTGPAVGRGPTGRGGYPAGPEHRVVVGTGGSHAGSGGPPRRPVSVPPSSVKCRICRPARRSATRPG